ncbi:MAG: methyltransferase domain-containing protein [Betaproteobacteria bacterium]|nr:methyltransferase domain-containing protein [Betaproteobacteria bacterium]
MPEVDPRAVRRRFERAAPTYPAASRLEAEVGGRMLERLDYVNLAPRRILEAGCGRGRESVALLKRYPGTALLELDFALPMLRRERSWLGRLRGRAGAAQLCGDFTRLPLAAASVDLVWSNMALHWAADPPAALREFARVLAADGLLLFSTLGPDTLAELRAAAGAARVHHFADMHDVGDALLAAGFSAPVMDVERLTMTYPDGEALLADLRASGQTCAAPGRSRGLAGRGLRSALSAALQARMRDGRLPVTFEVVYGHAWKGVPRERTEGRIMVQFRNRSH